MSKPPYHGGGSHLGSGSLSGPSPSNRSTASHNGYPAGGNLYYRQYAVSAGPTTIRNALAPPQPLTPPTSYSQPPRLLSYPPSSTAPIGNCVAYHVPTVAQGKLSGQFNGRVVPPAVRGTSRPPAPQQRTAVPTTSAAKIAVPSSYSSSSLSLPRVSVSQSSFPAAAAVDPDVVAGVREQHSWQERAELLPFTGQLMALCHLSPFSSEWNFSMEQAENSLLRYKARAVRHLTCLVARSQDNGNLLQDRQSTIACREEARGGISKSKVDLSTAKRKRRHREEYEKISRDVCKKSSTRELQSALIEELSKKEEVDNLTAKAEARIQYRQKQAGVVLQAAADFKKSLSQPIPGVG